MIEVGEYVRTKDGYIFKIVDIDNIFIYVDKEVRYIGETNASIDYIKKSSVVKHSKNIIDLIELGDIVHTRDVLNEDITYIWSKEYLDALKEDLKNGIELIEILTKEQYMQNCYKKAPIRGLFFCAVARKRRLQ